MENTEIMKSETFEIEIPPELEKELDDITADGQTQFAKIGPDGIEIGGITRPETFVHITSWSKHHYNWIGGKDKEVRTDMTNDQAKAEGFKPGAEIVLQPLNPELPKAPVTLSLPQSSYYRFSNFCKHLKNKGVTPAHVVTKISTILTPFKVGKPQPVCTFEAAGLWEDYQTKKQDNGAPEAQVEETESNDSSDPWS